MKLRAANNRIIIEAAAEKELETTESGIILAKSAAKIQNSGRIISMGGLADVSFDNGKVQVGDMIRFFEHAPIRFAIGEKDMEGYKEYLTITDDDVICKLEEE